MPIERIVRGDTLELRLRGGRGNALGPRLLAALAEQLERARSEGAPPLLLSAEGRSFSTGLDLRHSFACDRPQLEELMRSFHESLASLLFYPAASAALVTGHALAGGALLALCCDARFVAEGAGRIGIHGAQLGIGYPDIALEIVGQRFGRRHAERILYAGELFAAEQAHEIGFATAVAPAEKLRERAEGWLRGQGSPRAFAANKARLLAAARARLIPMDEVGARRFADHWFGGDTQRRLADALAKLSARPEGDDG